MTIAAGGELGLNFKPVTQIPDSNKSDSAGAKVVHSAEKALNFVTGQKHEDLNHVNEASSTSGEIDSSEIANTVKSSEMDNKSETEEAYKAKISENVKILESLAVETAELKQRVRFLQKCLITLQLFPDHLKHHPETIGGLIAASLAGLSMFAETPISKEVLDLMSSVLGLGSFGYGLGKTKEEKIRNTVTGAGFGLLLTGFTNSELITQNLATDAQGVVKGTLKAANFVDDGITAVGFVSQPMIKFGSVISQSFLRLIKSAIGSF